MALKIWSLVLRRVDIVFLQEGAAFLRKQTHPSLPYIKPLLSGPYIMLLSRPCLGPQPLKASVFLSVELLSCMAT